MVRNACLVPFLSSILVAQVSCGSPDPSPPAVDPFQACIEVCVNGSAGPCTYPGPDVDCELFCARLFENAGPHCQDEIAAEWACVGPAMKAQNDYCTLPLAECGFQMHNSRVCVDKLGCTSPHHGFPAADCSSGTVGPNQEVGCACEQYCMHVIYDSKCWNDGATTVCECYQTADSNGWNARILVGMCEGGAVCDDRLYKGCCNQFYKLAF
jgi:hypothetical protein